ncbi:MAG: hypothetical protein RJA75_279 [Actinomycetota bacterium]|jgi:hypothetical protein
MSTTFYPSLFDFMWLFTYLGLGILSSRFGVRQGYKLLPAIILSYLITPLGAYILFKLFPRKS